jgi:hypothetical protein
MALSSRKQLADKSVGSADLTPEQQAAIEVLLENGIAPPKAKALAQQFDPQLIVDQIEYAQSQMSIGPNGKQKIGKSSRIHHLYDRERPASALNISIEP